MVIRCVRIVAYSCSFFILIALYYSIVLTFQNVLIHCHSDSSFHFGAIINSAILHILEHIEFWWASVLIWSVCALNELKCWVFSKVAFQKSLYNLHCHQPSMRISISPHL